jgi:hypothetical protein
LSSAAAAFGSGFFFNVALVSAVRQEADPTDRSRRGSMRISWSLLQ